jgi:hypothetical protein
MQNLPPALPLLSSLPPFPLFRLCPLFPAQSKGHEYFDVWSPEIATTYGQNFWTSMGDHPLPDHIIKRFDGKVIAITGYEQDQVLVDPVGHPGVNPDRDVSVPINWAYNHHCEQQSALPYSHGAIVDDLHSPAHTHTHAHTHARTHGLQLPSLVCTDPRTDSLPSCPRPPTPSAPSLAPLSQTWRG